MAPNPDSTSTLILIEQNVFEGWRLIKGLDCNLFGTDGFLSTWVNHIASIPLTVKAQWACSIPLLSTQLELNILPKDEDDDLILLRQEEQSDAWLKALEQTAQQHWKQLF